MEFTNYLAPFKTAKGETHTHTIIGDKALNIFGGSYTIPADNWLDFMETYWNYVFYSGNKAYMTEKQLDNGAVYVDLDFRYAEGTNQRLHNENHIIDVIMKYYEMIGKILDIPADDEIKVFVMEKDKVNELDNKTKDGIHILFGIKMTKECRKLLRQMVMKDIQGLLSDLPLTNTIEEVIDNGIAESSVNCQMYGSRKPNHQAYKLTHKYIVKNDDITPEKITTITAEDLLELSVQYDGHPEYSVKEKVINILKEVKEKKQSSILTPPNSRSPTPQQVFSPLHTNYVDEYMDLLFNVIGNGYNTDNSKVVSRKDRLCICNVLKSNHYKKDIYINYCGLREGQGKDTASETWDSIEIKNTTPLFVLQGLAKRLNANGYDKWFIKNKKYIKLSVLKKGENKVAEYITDYLSNKLIYCIEKWWFFDTKLRIWRFATPNAIIINEVQRQIDIARKTLLTRITEEEDDEKKKQYRKMDKEYELFYSVVGKSSFAKQMENCLKEYLLDMTFVERLDVLPYKVAYRNGILDLKTLEFNYTINAEDFITSYIPYDYEEGTEEDIEWVKAELLKICNCNEEHLQYYLSFLGYSMTGDSDKEQSFFNILGQKASNGKSSIFEALMHIIPNYIKKAENNIFECNYGSRHKEIATWRGMRILWVNELSKKKQDADVIKDVADGTSVTYQVMYKINAKMPITFKLAVVSNNTLKIDGDRGIGRRLKTFQMDSEFLDVETDDYENKIFKKDKTFPEKLKTKYKYALMSLIYQYSQAFYNDGLKMKSYPEDWNETTKQIIQETNKFQEFFEKWFIEDPNGTIAKKKLEEFLKENNQHVHINDELIKMKITFKYNSQEKKGGFKGWFSGFRQKTPEEIEEENKAVEAENKNKE